MAITLLALVQRLESVVAQRDGIPAEYSQLVKDAVTQLGLDVPIVTAATINIVAGTAEYALPADFLSLIELVPLPAMAGTAVTSGGLVPLGVGGWAEQFYIEGDKIRFDPAPSYTGARTLRYAGGYALANGAYSRLTENGARIALMYAQYSALTEQAAAVAGDSFKFTIGDESYDKSGQSGGIRSAAQAALANYQNAVKPLKGYGISNRQSPWTADV
jgi:hypothetical protein